MMLTTTLNAIRAHDPCVEGWGKLLAHLGKTGPDDEPVTLATILDSNGLDDALWALRCVTGHDRKIRHYAVWCARQVQHLMTDPRSLAALDVAERYADGLATGKELSMAWAAARDAARDTARGAACGAVEYAAWNAAWAAAEVAAWDAVWAAARAAVWDAAGGAARAAAGDAVWAAARAAVWDAAGGAQAAEFRRRFCTEDA
jgi:hypothetical protein